MYEIIVRYLYFVLKLKLIAIFKYYTCTSPTCGYTKYSPPLPHPNVGTPNTRLPCLTQMWVHQILPSLASPTCGYTKYSPCLTHLSIHQILPLPYLWIHQILTSLASPTCWYTKYSPPLPRPPVDTPNTHLPCLTHLSIPRGSMSGGIDV